MAIRFPCPSCQQPIEVDDAWAGQSVGCPYCQTVVTAPRTSDWPPSGVPMGSPAGGGLAPPPPPRGHRVSIGNPDTGGAGGGWALVLAILCGLLGASTCMAVMFALGVMVEQRVGTEANPEQLRRAVQQIAVDGQMPWPAAGTPLLLAGIVSGLGSLWLAGRCLLRGRGRRGMAIMAIVINVCAMGVPCLLYVAVHTQQPMPTRQAPTTHPNGGPEEPATIEA